MSLIPCSMHLWSTSILWQGRMSFQFVAIFVCGKLQTHIQNQREQCKRLPYKYHLISETITLQPTLFHPPQPGYWSNSLTSNPGFLKFKAETVFLRTWSCLALHKWLPPIFSFNWKAEEDGSCPEEQSFSCQDVGKWKEKQLTPFPEGFPEKHFCFKATFGIWQTKYACLFSELPVTPILQAEEWQLFTAHQAWADFLEMFFNGMVHCCLKFVSLNVEEAGWPWCLVWRTPFLNGSHVSVDVAIAGTKHHDQNLGRKGFMWLHILSHSPLRAAKAGTPTRNLEAGGGAKVMEECYVLACSP